jgi:hypothetical protein
VKRPRHQGLSTLDAQATSATDIRLLSGNRKTINDIPARFPELDQTALGDVVELLNELLDKIEGDPNFKPDDAFRSRLARLSISDPDVRRDN